MIKKLEDSRILKAIRPTQASLNILNISKYCGGCQYRAFLDGDINEVDSYCYECENI